MVDQQFLSSSATTWTAGIYRVGESSPTMMHAQTFTVGIAGTLAGVDIVLSPSSDGTSDPVGDVTISLFPVLDELPSGASLGTRTIPASSLSNHQAIYHVDFLGLGLAMMEGRKVALGLSGMRSGWNGAFGNQGFYPGGAAVVFYNGRWVESRVVDPFGLPGDFFFSTFVQVPEPRTSQTLGSIFALLMVLRIRKTKPQTSCSTAKSG